MAKAAEPDIRDRISNVFTRIEDITYIGLGVLLAAGALILLGAAAWFLYNNIFSGEIRENIVDLLDQILLILMVLEILYTVQVSFREHTLSPEPFLVVGLIAAVRRVLIITAEFSKPEEVLEAAFRNAMMELGLLTVLILSLVLSLQLLKRQSPAKAERD
ncbi:MAG TPA: phosphate-starvation-inducible PsiE family protein [Candidatus Binatia bacterium]|nr:phosphate-starvation-inducible PsiE family protein [Candidatus Binatia bacterium]